VNHIIEDLLEVIVRMEMIVDRDLIVEVSQEVTEFYTVMTRDAFVDVLEGIILSEDMRYYVSHYATSF
jgi:hypothetical protein